MIFSYKKVNFEIGLKSKNTIFNYKNTSNNYPKKYNKKELKPFFKKNFKCIKANISNTSLQISKSIKYPINQIHKYVTRAQKEYKNFYKLKVKKLLNIKKQYFLIKNLQKRKRIFSKLEINYRESINQYFIKTIKHSFVRFKIKFYIKIKQKIESLFYRNISFIKIHFDILEQNDLNANNLDSVCKNRIISYYDDSMDCDCIHNEYNADTTYNYHHKYNQKFIKEYSLKENSNNKSNIKYNRKNNVESDNKYRGIKQISDRKYLIELNIFNSKGFEKLMMNIKKEYTVVDVNIENDMIILINKRVVLSKKYLNLYEKEIIMDKDIEISFIENILDLYPYIKTD